MASHSGSCCGIVMLALTVGCGEGADPTSAGASPTPSFAEATPSDTPLATPTGAASTLAPVLLDELSPPLRDTLFLSMNTFSAGEITVVRPEDGAQIYTADVEDALGPFCARPGCIHHQVTHTLEGDQDQLTLIGTRVIDMTSALYRITLDDPARPLFKLTAQDWTKVPLSGCEAPAKTTCGAPLDDTGADHCRIGFGHAFEIVDDRVEDQHISVMVADHTGGRLVGMHLDYAGGNSCGVVDWVFDSGDEGWLNACEPNSLHRLFDPKGELLLVTCRNTDHQLGAGRLVLYRVERSEDPEARPNFQQLWVYPPMSVFGMLNSPHDARLSPRAEGDGYTLSYAHTGGLGQDLDHDLVSSVGVATLERIDAQPVYLADLYLDGSAREEPLRIVTTVEWQEPGWFMVSDNHGLGPQDDGLPARNLLFQIPDVTPSGKTGVWTPEHLDQAFVPMDSSLVGVTDCGSAEAYQQTWLQPEDFGGSLRAMAASEGSRCGR